MIRLFTAVLIGKLIFSITRLFKIGGGSAAPGYYALKIYPDLVARLSRNMTTQVIVTGTNGKTTTSRLIGHFLENSGYKVIRNSTGSNLERGIASALIKYTNPFSLKTKEDLAVWEVDEAAFNQVSLKLKPNVVVFLNIYRDQLDRYGEINSVLKKWSETLKKLDPGTLVLLNGDDGSISKLEEFFSGKVQKFGLKNKKILGEDQVKKLDQPLDIEASNIKEKDLESMSFQLTVNNKQLTVNLPLPGIYHIYDLLAAFGVGYNLNLGPELMLNSLSNYTPAFGRMEKIKMEGKEVFLFLIKNPRGATEVFETIGSHINSKDRLLIALNDNFADGTDVSWIWDGEFEKLAAAGHHLPVIASGIRAYDLAIRLKYVGFEDIVVEEDLRKALRESVKHSQGRIFVLPTYTAMLELQEILAKMGVKKHYWRE